MRTLGSSHATFVLLSCLIGPILGCNPDTFGYGEADAEAGQSDGFDADLGEDSMDAGDPDMSGGSNGDDQGGGNDNGDDGNGGDGGGEDDGNDGGNDGGDGEGAESCLG